MSEGKDAREPGRTRGQAEDCHRRRANSFYSLGVPASWAKL